MNFASVPVGRVGCADREATELRPIDRMLGIPFTSGMENQFIYAACKFDYQHHCKAEILAKCPNLRFSFSRPGFLTFKIASGAPDFSAINALTFVRTTGLTIGKVLHENPKKESQDLFTDLVGKHQIEHVHFWDRELGHSNEQALLEYFGGSLPANMESLVETAGSLNLKINQRAGVNQNVLDLIKLSPTEIWIGLHRVEAPHLGWPGGVIRFEVPPNPISRAYYKAREAMIWSRFPMQPDDVCVEIGCSPGGSVLALLEQDLQVIGIDPADVDDTIRAHPKFKHLKMRGADVRKKQLATTKWLLADSNVAPQYTLDTVEEIATNQHIHLSGMLLTLKLLKSEMANQMEAYRDRIRKMGFQYVRTRQLAFNRNEVCLAALKRKSILRFGKQSKKSRMKKASE